MKKYNVPVSGFIKVRAYVEGFATIEAKDEKDALRKIELMNVGVDLDSLPEGVSIEDDLEWMDDMSDFGAHIHDAANSGEVEDITVTSDISEAEHLEEYEDYHE